LWLRSGAPRMRLVRVVLAEPSAVRGSSRTIQSHRDPRTALGQRTLKIAQTRVRGYRKIRVLLDREGWAVGKNVYRLYRKEGLMLCHRIPRRRKAVAPQAHRPTLRSPNRAWTLDFVADQLTDGRRFRALTVVNVITRESLAIEVGQRLRGEDIVVSLNRLKVYRGVPTRLFCDNGSEFSNQLVDFSAYYNKVSIALSGLGKPTDNAM